MDSRLLLVAAAFGVPLLVAPRCVRCASAEDPVVVEEDEEAGGVEGIVSLSDGAVLRGTIRFTDGKRLRLFDLHERRVYRLDLSQIESVRTLVEAERLEEAWAFEEEGSRRKVKLGWSYPLREYRQEVQLVGGQVLEGHCYATVAYIDDGSRERKVVIPRVQKGKRGETLDDLVYPRKIELGAPSPHTVVGRAESAELARLAGRSPGLSALVLVHRRSRTAYPCAVGSGGAYRARGLLPGAHAVFLRRGDEVVAGLTELGRGAAARDLREGVERRIDSLAEFFDEKKAVLVGGTDASPWILVELRRRGPTTLGASGGGSARVVRWEVWCFERTGDDWTVARRLFVDRRLLSGSDAFPRIDYRSEPRLWQVDLRAGQNELLGIR